MFNNLNALVDVIGTPRAQGSETGGICQRKVNVHVSILKANIKVKNGWTDENYGILELAFRSIEERLKDHSILPITKDKPKNFEHQRKLVMSSMPPGPRYDEFQSKFDWLATQLYPSAQDSPSAQATMTGSELEITNADDLNNAFGEATSAIMADAMSDVDTPTSTLSGKGKEKEVDVPVGKTTEKLDRKRKRRGTSKLRENERAASIAKGRELKKQLQGFRPKVTMLKAQHSYDFDPDLHVAREGGRCKNCADRPHPWDCFHLKSDLKRKPLKCTNCKRGKIKCMIYEGAEDNRIQPPLPTTNEYWAERMKVKEEEMDDDDHPSITLEGQRDELDFEMLGLYDELTRPPSTSSIKGPGNNNVSPAAAMQTEDLGPLTGNEDENNKQVPHVTGEEDELGDTPKNDVRTNEGGLEAYHATASSMEHPSPVQPNGQDFCITHSDKRVGEPKTSFVDVAMGGADDEPTTSSVDDPGRRDTTPGLVPVDAPYPPSQPQPDKMPLQADRETELERPNEGEGALPDGQRMRYSSASESIYEPGDDDTHPCSATTSMAINHSRPCASAEPNKGSSGSTVTDTEMETLPAPVLILGPDEDENALTDNEPARPTDVIAEHLTVMKLEKKKAKELSIPPAAPSTMPSFTEPRTYTLDELMKLWSTPAHMNVIADIVVSRLSDRFLKDMMIMFYPEGMTQDELEKLGPVSNEMKRAMRTITNERKAAEAVRVLATALEAREKGNLTYPEGQHILDKIIDMVAGKINSHKEELSAPSSSTPSPLPSASTSSSSGILSQPIIPGISVGRCAASFLTELGAKQERRLELSREFEYQRLRSQIVAAGAAENFIQFGRKFLQELKENPKNVDTNIAKDILYDQKKLSEYTAQFRGSLLEFPLVFNQEFHDILDALSTELEKFI
ncbi:hypothetical protein BDN70DRAFT_892827 [Pholiota conissans]|uniref:Uncharacterized protein n=1 Tax=Pholiota conissans TaxID=109636 RepID=A0A9P5Z5N0_9AGAR|nr:hypothetical protein BDN70DRAFT_892827 [Pholiota conissans]